MADEKELSEHGLKTAAGRALTRHLTTVGQEMMDYASLDGTGPPRKITKIEALARRMWELAFGYEIEERKRDSKTGKPILFKRVIAPDKALIALIYDRLEGKVVSNEDEGAKRPPISEKVKDQAQRRVRQLSKQSTGETSG